MIAFLFANFILSFLANSNRRSHRTGGINMREVNVSNVMLPHVQKVLVRDHISYQIKQECVSKGEESVRLLLPETSNREFTVILEDALCEKQREETQSKIPVYSYRTLRNLKKRNRLMSLNGMKSFHILRQDVKKCQVAALA